MAKTKSDRNHCICSSVSGKNDDNVALNSWVNRLGGKFDAREKYTG
jgi:hypothetical protein